MSSAANCLTTPGWRRGERFPRETKDEKDVNARLLKGRRRRFLTAARKLLGGDWWGTNLEHDTAMALMRAEARGRKATS